MKIFAAWILLGVVVSVNCQGRENELLLMKNYVEHLGEKSLANCVKQSGVPREVVDNFHYSLTMTKDKRFMCYVKCSFHTTHFMDQSGVLNMNMVKYLTDATNSVFLDKIEKNCKQENTDDSCETAFRTYMCVLGTAKEESLYA